MNPQWLIFGAGGHGRVILDVLLDRCAPQYILFLDDSPDALIVDGVEVRRLTTSLLPSSRILHGIGDLKIRRYLQMDRFPEAEWTKIAARTAHIARGASIAPGSQILQHAYVGPGTSIGNGCIVNNHASIDHDCKIGGFCHVAPGTVLCGGVSVGDGTLIGAGVTIIPRVSVGLNCIITAGSTVLRNIPDNSILDVMGNVKRNRHARTTNLSDHNEPR